MVRYVNFVAPRVPLDTLFSGEDREAAFVLGDDVEGTRLGSRKAVRYSGMRTAVVLVVLGLMVALVAACRHEAKETTVDATPPPLSAAAAAAAPSAPATGARARTIDAGAPEVATVLRWNAALNAHDGAALEALYAPAIRYYGHLMEAAECRKAVMAALAKDPTFHQDITIERVIWTKEGTSELATVSFTKRTGDRTYDAYVVVTEDGWKIAAESDHTTDANLAKRGACLAFGADVTLSGKLSEDTAGGSRVTFFNLDHAVCVVRGDRPDADPNYDAEPERVDDVTFVHTVLGEKVKPECCQRSPSAPVPPE